MSRTGAKKGIKSTSATKGPKSGSTKVPIAQPKSKTKSTSQAKGSDALKKAGSRSRDEEIRRKLDQKIGKMSTNQLHQSKETSSRKKAPTMEETLQQLQALSQKE